MPNPMDYDSQDEWMGDCVSQAIDEGKDQDQAVAMCSSMWSERKTKAPIRKTHADETHQGMEFVLSDATPDRYGDVIQAEGWDLANFKKNPIALFNHNSDFPIGRWEKLSVRDGALRGHLRMAPAGTSARIDEIRKLIEAGILKAVSVGFRPIESKPRSKSAPGEHFIRSELVETSLVSVPANPNALAVAKSLKVSRETLDVVFAKHGSVNTTIQRSGHGKHAEIPPKNGKVRAMSPLTKRIEDAQARIVVLRDQLNEHLKNVDDENPDDVATATTEELTTKIDAQEKSLDALKRAETQLAKTATGTTETRSGEQAIVVRHARPFAAPAQKVRPMDYIFKALAVDLKHFGEERRRPILEVLKENYGDGDVGETTRTVMARMITRAAAIPADTTTSGWADTLVQTVIGDFIQSLMPISVYPQLASRGGSFTFGRNGTISLPARTTTTTVAGAFVAQGAPIPVRQGAFAPITLTPKKMGVITTMTREITEHSTPAIEAILRQAMLEDTAVAIDTILLDATAASAIRPAGLKAGVTKVTATSGAGIAALIGDLKGLVAALITNTKGNLRAPVWIINPGDVLAAALTQAAAGGDLPFRDELAQGTLLGYPVIQSTTGLSDMMVLMDAADFMTATGDTPQFSVSDQAVLHMEDTTPLAIGTAGTPPTVAAPVRSLWQTDSLAIRMLLDINWSMRRTGVVQWTDTMTWN